MFWGDREETRRVFVRSWRKSAGGVPLEPLEALVAEVIGMHPEYHDLLEQDGAAVTTEFDAAGGRTNPFLHMGLHVAIREQVATDRPAGITEAHRRLCARCGDVHEAEHRIMDCLAESLWHAQRTGTPPDEQGYLEAVRSMAG